MEVELNGYTFFHVIKEIPAVIYQCNFPSLAPGGKTTFNYYSSAASDDFYASFPNTVAKFTITKIKKQIS